MLCETAKTSEVLLQEAIADETERRRLNRKPFLRKATITAIDGRAVRESAFCRDISRDGIGLLHERHLEAGTEFSLVVPLLGHNLELHCNVSWCRQVGEQQYFSGNAYHCLTTPQSLVLLSVALSQALNRRLHRRYPFVRPMQVEDAAGNRVPAFCRDISRSGIGLIVREPLEIGHSKLTLQTADGTELTTSADLRRCTPIGEGWYAGGGRFSVEDVDDQRNLTELDAPR